MMSLLFCQLKDAAVQHREVQGNESRLFRSYFDRIVIWKGGYAYISCREIFCVHYALCNLAGLTRDSITWSQRSTQHDSYTSKEGRYICRTTHGSNLCTLFPYVPGKHSYRWSETEAEVYQLWRCFYPGSGPEDHSGECHSTCTYNQIVATCAPYDSYWLLTCRPVYVPYYTLHTFYLQVWVPRVYSMALLHESLL